MQRLTEEQINMILLKVQGGKSVDQACKETKVDFFLAAREEYLNPFFADKIKEFTTNNLKGK